MTEDMQDQKTRAADWFRKLRDDIVQARNEFFQAPHSIQAVVIVPNVAND